jgi:DNA/RNA-binding protein KIN17
MNSTQWESLTAFCKHLGKQGLAVVDETEKGWFVTYIDRDPKALERQARSEQVRKNELDEEERQKRAIEAQIAAAEAKKRELGIDLEADQEGNDYNAAEREALVGTGKVELSMKLGSIGGTNKRKIGAVISNAFAEPTGIHSSHDMDKSDAKGSSISDMSKRFRNTSSGEIEFEHATTLNSTLSASSSYKPKSNIESLMMQEEQRKSSMINQDDKQNRTDYWLHEGIVVKIINKNVAEGRFYKQKGVVVRVVDKYVGEVKVDGATLRLDQEHLETVIPKIGGDVLILNGRGRGQVATVVSINEADYNCDIKVHASVPGGASIYGGRVLQSIEYEDISKYAYAESSQN